MAPCNSRLSATTLLNMQYTFSCVPPWWRHQMETFSALLTLCVENSPVTGEFPSQRPMTRSFVFLWSAPEKRLSKQSWGWWYETPSRLLWRHCNDERIFPLPAHTRCRATNSAQQELINDIKSYVHFETSTDCNPTQCSSNVMMTPWRGNTQCITGAVPGGFLITKIH